MKLKDIISTYISGDWGNEQSSNDSPCAVYCVRGADIVPITNNDYDNIPLRYVSERSKSNRLLQPGDIIIEKSGGSPTQSTGRVVFISSDVVAKKTNILCSNFCVAFRVKKNWNPKFVYYYWQYVYNAGVFFNYEGKTSGLRNLQLENAVDAIEIPELSLTEQDRIVSILSELEHKIAVNREINRNLPLSA